MKNTYLLAFALTAAVAAAMTSCGTTAITDSSPASETSTSASVSTSASAKTSKTESAKEDTNSASSETASIEQLSDNSSDETYTKRDLAQVADTSDATAVTVSDGNTINITEEGVYVISGSAEDCTIRVEADENAKVQLVLDGVEISNSDFPAIYVVSADKVFVTTTDSENTLTVSGEFSADGDTNTDAVIFSKDDLVLNGVGTLNVTSNYGNGITCKDDLKVTGGTYNVNSALDAFEANDSISISDGEFTVNTNKDGFHCENDDSEGTITISGGTFTINGRSDGIQACALLQIDGGTFDITASEGIEATYVLINGGDVNISASDDGINGSYKSAAVGTPAVEINGGNVTITMSGSDVDAIDVNGNITVSGGTINISSPQQGPSESFDYDGTATYNGGTIIINGSQVDSIPQASMMGGGGMGGFGGGQMF